MVGNISRESHVVCRCVREVTCGMMLCQGSDMEDDMWLLHVVNWLDNRFLGTTRGC